MGMSQPCFRLYPGVLGAATRLRHIQKVAEWDLTPSQMSRALVSCHTAPTVTLFHPWSLGITHMHVHSWLPLTDTDRKVWAFMCAWGFRDRTAQLLFSLQRPAQKLCDISCAQLWTGSHVHEQTKTCLVHSAAQQWGSHYPWRAWHGPTSFSGFCSVKEPI